MLTRVHWSLVILVLFKAKFEVLWEVLCYILVLEIFVHDIFLMYCVKN